MTLKIQVQEYSAVRSPGPAPWAAALLVLAGQLALPALALASEAAHDAGSGPDLWLLKRLLNFAVLAALLFGLLRKPLSNFFTKRTREIQTHLETSLARHRDVTEQLSAERRRFDGLAAELAGLREHAEEQAAAERRALLTDARKEADRIIESIDDRIAAETERGRRELRAYAADLAVELAEERFEKDVDPEADRHFVHTIIRSSTRSTD